MKFDSKIVIWSILLLNAGLMSVYLTEYYLQQTGLVFAPYGYSPIFFGSIINVIGILSLGIIYQIKKRQTKCKHRHISDWESRQDKK